METLFFAVVIISGVLALTRVPGLTQSRNQSIFLSGLCACLAFGLMLPSVYGFLDQFFFRTNFTDLFAKLALLLAINILVCEIARTLRNTRAQRLTAGISGKTVLVLTFALSMGLFALTDTPYASPGLGAFIDDPLVLAYNTVIVVYIAYLGLLLLGPLIKDARTPPQPLRRLASALIAAGFGLAIIRALVMVLGFGVSGLYDFGQILSGITALLVVAGLASAWLAFRKYGNPPIKQSALRID